MIQTLNEGVSCNMGEGCVYNTGLYVPRTAMKICPAKLLMQYFTHPCLSTAIFHSQQADKKSCHKVEHS